MLVILISIETKPKGLYSHPPMYYHSSKQKGEVKDVGERRNP